MKYSDIVLTDDNMDDEVEKLEKSKGSDYPMFEYSRFVDSLPEGFICQTLSDGTEEWTNHKVHNGYVEGQNAYEFANGFLVMDVATPI